MKQNLEEPRNDGLLLRDSSCNASHGSHANMEMTVCSTSSDPAFSRRAFLACAAAAASSLFFTAFDGGIAYAEEAEDGSLNWKITVIAKWQVGVVLYDPDTKKALPGVAYKITSLYNGKEASGTTNGEGIALVDIKELSEPDHLGRNVYEFWGKVLLSKEGYRTFETAKVRVRGNKPIPAATKALDGRPYAQMVSFDGCDVQYTSPAEFNLTPYNNATHTFTVKVVAPANSDVRVALFHNGQDWNKTAKAQFDAASGCYIANISGEWLNSSLSNALWSFWPDTKTELKVRVGNTEFTIPTTMVAKKGNLEDSSNGSGGIGFFSGGSFKQGDGADDAPMTGEVLGFAEGEDAQLGSIAITAPDWVPYLGGQSLNIWTPTLPVFYDIDVADHAMLGVVFSGTFLRQEDGKPLSKGWKKDMRISISQQAEMLQGDWRYTFQDLSLIHI